MRCGRAVAGGASAVVVLTLLAPATAQAYPRPGTTERVSVSSGGHQATGYSRSPVVSADGRFVAFASDAADLVPGDTNGRTDVFVRDRQSGVTERVSVSNEGAQATGGDSAYPAISGDGRYVAFRSAAVNLVSGDTNGQRDVFVRDRQEGVTERVSVSTGGAQVTGGDSASPAISGDGRFVAFSSGAVDVVPGDTNDAADVFVRDRQQGSTERVSVSSDGAQATGGDSFRPAISADGRYVAFTSSAVDVVLGDFNGVSDVFVHDRQSGITERVSVSSGGGQANGGASTAPAVSADGRFVAFESGAVALAPGDTNGAWDVFVHDRQSGITERVSVSSDGAQATGGLGSRFPAISGDGRFIAFESYAVNLVRGDTNDAVDVFVRDRGPAMGIGGVSVSTAPNGVSVSGWATFSHESVSAVDDPADGHVAARDVGGEVVEAEVTHRAEAEDVLLRLDVASMPGPLIGGAPGVLYRWGFQVDGVEHEVRATRLAPAAAAPSAEPYVALFRCDPTCSEVASLAGGIGTTGSDVRVAVPLQELGIAEAATVTGVVASTSLGEPSAVGPLVELDEVTVGDLVVSQPRVDLGIAPASVAEADVTYATRAALAEGRFAGTVNTAGLPAGSYRVWARACLGELCGSRFVEVTLS